MIYKPRVGDIFFCAVGKNGRAAGFRFFEIIDVTHENVSLKEISSEIRPSADPEHPPGTFLSVPQNGKFKGKTYKEQNVEDTVPPAIMVGGRIMSVLWNGRCLFFSSPGTHIVNADERGDFGYDEKSSKTVVIALSVIPHSKEFQKIARKYPKNTRGSSMDDVLKFHSSSDDVRAAVVNDIATTEVEIYATTYWKDRGSGSDETKSGSQIYRGLFKEIADILMREIDAESLLFVIDDSTFISRNAASNIVTELAQKYGKTILDCVQVRTKTELLLQTHDFVVGGLGVREEDNVHSYVKRLGPHIMVWKKNRQ